MPTKKIWGVILDDQLFKNLYVHPVIYTDPKSNMYGRILYLSEPARDKQGSENLFHKSGNFCQISVTNLWHKTEIFKVKISDIFKLLSHTYNLGNYRDFVWDLVKALYFNVGSLSLLGQNYEIFYTRTCKR